MKDAMQYDIDKPGKPITIEKLQDDLQKLRNDVRTLEIQVAALSNPEIVNSIGKVEFGAPPHPTSVKCQKCKSCKHMRMPHKSNAHYTCVLRHENIEPSWTCGLYHDKKSQNTWEASAYCGQ